MPRKTEELSPEEKQLRQEQKELHRKQAQRRVQTWRKEMDARWTQITGSLKHPRPSYVDADTAASLALCETKVVNRALWEGKIPFEQPVWPQKLILRTDFEKWMEEAERTDADFEIPRVPDWVLEKDSRSGE